MTKRDFQVGDLVKFNPEVFGDINRGTLFSIKQVTDQPSILVSVVRHDNRSVIGAEVYLDISWMCRATIKSKFERRKALCR